MNLILALAIALAQDEAEIRKAIEGAIGSVVDGNGPAFVDRWDVVRMAREIETAAQLKEGSVVAAKEALRSALERLPRQIAGTPFAWTGVKITRVRVDEKRETAEGFGVVRMGEEKTKARFALVRDGDAWRIYDLDFLEFGMRYSILIGGIVAAAEKNPKEFGDLAKCGVLLQKVGLAIATGDAEEALKHIEKGKSMKLPPSFQAYLGFLEGTAYLGLERPEDALKAADRTLEIDKNLILAHLVRATALLGLERHEDAIRAAEVYVEKIGEDADAYWVIGQSHEALDRRDAAIAAHRKGVAADDEEYENRHALGRLLAAKGDREEAVRLLQQAIKNSPEWEDLYGTVADELIEVDAPAVLLDLARHQSKQGGGDARVLLHQGHALRRLGKPDEALKFLQEAAKHEDVEYLASEELVYTLADLGRDKEALTEARDGAYLLAYVHAAAQRHDEAIKYLRMALREDPTLHVQMAREKVFEAIRGQDAGRALLERARAKARYDEKAWGLLEESAKLAELSEQYLKTVPDDPDGWYYLGLSLQNLKKYAEAEKAYLTGVQHETEDSARERFWQELGRVLAHLGRTKEALEYAKKLDRLASRHVAAYAHAVAGNEAEALRELERMFAIAPAYHAMIAENPVFHKVCETEAGRRALERARAREAFIEEAWELENDEVWDGLRKLAERRIAEDPDDYRGWVRLGRARQRLGEHANAEEALREGLKKAEPEDATEFWEELARATAHTKPEEALAILEKIQYGKDWIGAYVHVVAGREREALDALEKALDEFPYRLRQVEAEKAFATIRKTERYAAMARRARERMEE